MFEFIRILQLAYLYLAVNRTNTFFQSQICWDCTMCLSHQSFYKQYWSRISCGKVISWSICVCVHLLTLALSSHWWSLLKTVTDHWNGYHSSSINRNPLVVEEGQNQKRSTYSGGWSEFLKKDLPVCLIWSTSKFWYLEEE